jgi:pimeloyl-ACP methyl ester carboxylesterase
MKFRFFIVAFVSIYFAKAQELARRPMLGIKMEKITEDTKRIMDLPALKGVLINGIVPNSTAEQTGLQKGDVLLKINSIETNSPADAMKEVASHRGGENFTYELVRGKKIISGKSVFKAIAVEKYKDIEMKYTAVKTTNGLQRLIVSKPVSKTKSPALIFIGGIGCYSLDNPLDTTLSETQLLNSLTRAGYVCVRAEKPGVGDNTQCKKCEDISFKEEVEGYVSVVQKIKTYDYIDSSKIYIIGHSMGGVMAPLIAQQTNIKGIIAYGTIGSSFIEYLNKTRRTLGYAYGWKPEEIDDYIKESCECAGYYFVEKMPTADAIKKKEACKDYLTVFDYRSRKYNNELYELNIPAAWKPFTGKALLMWGGSDCISSKEDHEILTQAVNYYHPGNATFFELKGAEHGMKTASTFQEAINSPGSYNPEVGKSILDWLKQS